MGSTSSRIYARSSKMLSFLSSAVISTSWGLRVRTRPSASYSGILSQRNRRWTSRSMPYLRPLSSRSSRTLPIRMLTTKRPSPSKSILLDNSSCWTLTVSRPWSKNADLSKDDSLKKAKNQIMAIQDRKALWSEENPNFKVQKRSFLAFFTISFTKTKLT